jgi:HSP20 family protein
MQCNQRPQIVIQSMIWHMASSSERREDEEPIGMMPRRGPRGMMPRRGPRGMMPRRGVPSDNFMREMEERMRRERMTPPWPMPMEERMTPPWPMPMEERMTPPWPMPMEERMTPPWPMPMEERMTPPWPMPMDWQQFPSNTTTTIPEAPDMRMAVYELADRGDKFELQVELPGIEKEKIDLKATKYSIEISGKHSEKTEEQKTEEEKGKRYLYTERLYRSFYRNVSLPEEIVPSYVAAKLENGVLKVDLPKKTPTKAEEETTKIDIK